MNISKAEQRVLHVLAQGGRILHHRASDAEGDGPSSARGASPIVAVDCVTRDGYVLTDCNLALFQRLRRRRLIASTGGGPYRITRLGLGAVRAQLDNR